MRVLQKKFQTIPLKSALVLSGVQMGHSVSRKYSLGSSMDLVRIASIQQHKLMIAHNRTNDCNQQPQDSHYLGLYHFLQVKLRKDLFRQSVLPRLQRADKKHSLSASCSQLRPLNEATLSEKECCQNSKHR